MKRHKKFKPYIRQANGRERAEGIRMAIRLAYYQIKGGRYYVLVQHGFPSLAIAVGESRRAIIETLLPVKAGWTTYREWCKATQKRAANPAVNLLCQD